MGINKNVRNLCNLDIPDYIEFVPYLYNYNIPPQVGTYKFYAFHLLQIWSILNLPVYLHG